MTEPVWVTEEDCLSFHDKLLVRFGGAAGVRDRGLRTSALARPLHRFAYENASLLQLAAGATIVEEFAVWLHSVSTEVQ